jgi:hypothetical protein
VILGGKFEFGGGIAHELILSSYAEFEISCIRKELLLFMQSSFFEAASFQIHFKGPWLTDAYLVYVVGTNTFILVNIVAMSHCY